MPTAPKVKLNNGNEMPALGMGVVFLDIGDTQRTIDDAIAAGYRLFDNAAFYGNEDKIGQALKNNGIPREELFISSKLKNGHHKYDEACRECEKSLKALGVDYLDLYLIHYPCPEHGLYTEAWKALEHLYKEGLVKNIGVSNFHQEHIERILDIAEFKPVVDQLEFNPYLTINELREYLRGLDIVPEAWFPLGGPGGPPPGMEPPPGAPGPGPGPGGPGPDGPNPFKAKMFLEPAILTLAEKYKKSAAQIVLRWETQCGVIPVPKASNPAHMAENISIFDFAMTDEELATITALNRDNRCGPSGDNCNEYWD